MTAKELQKLVDGARDLMTPSAQQWLPDAFEQYEQDILEFVKTASKRELISLVARLEDMGNRGDTNRAFAILPVLVAYLHRFGKTPELCVETYALSVAVGGKFFDGASDLLREAHALENTNYHVLWQLWAGYTSPTFPNELRFADKGVDHERECLRRILAKYPEDGLACQVREWIDSTGRAYVTSADVPISVWRIEAKTLPTAVKPLPQLLADADP